MSEKPENKVKKSPHAEREERILAYWKENDIFGKSLEKNKDGKEFVFYEGPPTANGRPGIHHLEARAFKDAIPRYKTMRGFNVRRKGGWDTHGLPVELQVEKELGLKSKKEIETFGIEAFNEKCKESVWKYVHEWENFTDRMGYWVDLKDPYITYKPSYIESVWNIVKEVDKKGLLYKDYKVVPWCPRCGTGLSSHELAQGYQDVKDLAVTVKFKTKSGQKIGDFTTDDKTFILAWTTTPWTLPGNVGLAVGKNITYYAVTFNEVGELPANLKSLNINVNESYIASKEFWSKFGIKREDKSENMELKRYPIDRVSYNIWLVNNLINLSYEPLYPFLKDSVSGKEKEKLTNAFKVYSADFVTTTDGTGIVHIASMYGQDDFDVGTRENLPKYHLVNDDGTFKEMCGFLAGRFVKDEDVAVDIIKDLANRSTGSLLFHKEKHQHTYPFCWRCKTSLIYFARDSWYIRMSSLRKELTKENESINWEPAHIKEGRFGEWLKEVKDWAISRERYWGTPLPVWTCDECHKHKVAGSIKDVSRSSNNTYFAMRHGEAEQNTLNILNSDPSKSYGLTEKGRKMVEDSAKTFNEKIDIIYASPFPRTKETVEIVARILGIPESSIIYDDRLREMGMGELDGKSVDELGRLWPNAEDLFTTSAHGVENRLQIKRRVGSFIEEIDKKYQSKRILVVSHDSPLWLLQSVAHGYDMRQSLSLKTKGHFFMNNAEIIKIDYSIFPHNADFELDLHRPHIDAVTLECSCGGSMSRAKEVMDVWFDSGAMPFAQDHYPFDGDLKNGLSTSAKESGLLAKLFSRGNNLAYPADFISEAIDQTRGWFYTLHAIGILTGKGKAFKNVICLGHILDKDGKKMSKSLGNIIDPWGMMDTYGADALRFWMYSVNQPGDSKNFEEKTVDETIKKVFNLAMNVLSFYKMYEDKSSVISQQSEVSSFNILDRWIIARLNQTINVVTKGLDNYKFQEPTRSVRDFIGDLSQWYLRRSRDRFRSDDLSDKKDALLTLRYVLLTLSKIMAPFTPFFSEGLYREVGGDKESVHLDDWPESSKIDVDLLDSMKIVRGISSEGLEARMMAKINVRQPLKTLNVKGKPLGADFVELIRDEINVKEVIFKEDMNLNVMLDLTITSELKEEGMLRELVRAIQDLRKNKGLSVNDKAVLIIETDEMGKVFVEQNKNQVLSACAISDISFGENQGVEILIGDFKLKLSL